MEIFHEHAGSRCAPRRQPLFVLQGDSPDAALINTGKGWKVLASKAYTFARVQGVDTGGFYVAGPRESLDASLYPWGWEGLDFDASTWPDAAPLVQQFASPVALARGTQSNGSGAEWQLVPRSIPQLEQAPTRFERVRRASGVLVPGGFLEGRAPVVVPPRSKVSLLLDQGTLTIGYPVLTASGGTGASATVTYAEGLFDAAGHKGNRNEIEGKSIRGLRDTFRFDGGEKRRFQSLWLRAWRYVQVDIETADEPLRLDNVTGIFSAYTMANRCGPVSISRIGESSENGRCRITDRPGGRRSA